MPTWHRVAKSSEVGESAPFAIKIEGTPLALYRVEGQACAIGDICPHQGDIFLSPGWLENGTIECPMHQAVFDVRTGKCLSGPTSEDVPAYPVREEDGEVFVELK